jgi:exopolysaccharide production protein ExoQ
MLSDTTGFDVAQLSLAAIFAVAAALLLGRPRAVVDAVMIAPALAALVALSLASVGWSATPSTTVARALVLCGATCLGVCISRLCSPERLLQLTARALAIGGVLSLVAVAMNPSFAIAEGWHEGAWQGIYHHKNALGRCMALAVIAWFLLPTGSGRQSILRWAVVLASLVVLVMSDSATALIMVLVVVAAVIGLQTVSLRVGRILALALLCTAIAAPLLASASSQAESLLGAFGRDDTLTGRTHLWQEVIAEIRKSPLIGVAYGGFWQGLENGAGGIWLPGGWTPNDAHNGFLDLWLELGFVGVALFCLTLLNNIYRAVRYAHVQPGRSGLWPLAFFIVMIVYNMTESALLRPTNLLWIVYVALSCSPVIAGVIDAQPATNGRGRPDGARRRWRVDGAHERVDGSTVAEGATTPERRASIA